MFKGLEPSFPPKPIESEETIKGLKTIKKAFVDCFWESKKEAKAKGKQKGKKKVCVYKETKKCPKIFHLDLSKITIKDSKEVIRFKYAEFLGNLLSLLHSLEMAWVCNEIKVTLSRGANELLKKKRKVAEAFGILSEGGGWFSCEGNSWVKRVAF